MSDNDDFVEVDIDGDFSDLETKSSAKSAQAAVAVLGGAVPFAGGLAAWIADKWSGKEQKRANALFLAWFKMIQDELLEKQKVMGEIMARIDMEDEQVSDRVSSPEYQKLVRKAFRNWSGTESETKQKIVRNILCNAAAAQTSSDDVVSLFLDWISAYSEFHFEVISAIYNDEGITRLGVWQKLGRPAVREDAADADLYKLLFRDLSTGSVIRQHQEKDYHGNFLKKQPPKRTKGTGDRRKKSAFDDVDAYELTELGKQFVHYALNEITPKLEFNPDTDLA